MGKFGFQQLTFQARLMKLQIIYVDFKVKTLSGDHHQLFFTEFLNFFTVNLKLFSLHHK